MVLWFAVLALIGIALIAVLWPLLRGGAGASAVDAAIAFYEDRRQELERQRAAGELSEQDFLAAEAEQARQLLAIARGAEAGATSATRIARRRKLAAAIVMVALPALSLAAYLRIGAPGLPDLPLAARPSAPQNLDVAAALQKIETHLQKNPNDGRGFEVIAPVYLRLGRYDDAARAYGRVVELLGETPARLGDLGESLTAAANGVINAEARRAFERAVALDGDFAKARFYLAIAREQDGDAAGALADLTALLQRLPEGPARMRVEEEVTRMRGTPRDGAGEAIAKLPPEEQKSAIRAMVAALDQRLGEKGGSAEEWLRLVQARIVLGERPAAETALRRAREALAQDAAAGGALESLAREIAAMPAAAD